MCDFLNDFIILDKIFETFKVDSFVFQTIKENYYKFNKNTIPFTSVFLFSFF